ncbi:MAG TPA: tetratricopeptide repeat protein [Candidatus Hydrogenedentes bacterium]|nr:tetratricopeptide repeat protein [Candidatus Hydrogenedentota bacterium]HPG65198.1 tetratricopeptide repeat protein [Candidatus Hydrogenedentota bacterium]
MPDMWELASYVEANPNDHKARWTLAKIMYAANEYRLAVEHLQILQNEWPTHLNVVRYLAATYYRLNRFDEAARTLERGIEHWPNEMPLREQLARTLANASRPREAAKVWREIAEIAPDHPTALRNAEQLEKDEKPEQADADPVTGDTMLQGAIGVEICPSCGAENSAAFDRCSKCHAPLTGDVRDLVREFDGSVQPVAVPSRMPKASHAVAWLVSALVVTLGMAALGGYLTMNEIEVIRGRAAENVVLFRVADLLVMELLPTRIVLGVALLLLWPLALWTGLIIAREKAISLVAVAVVGALLAALTYLVSWAPVALLRYTPLAPALLSLVAIPLAFRTSVGKAFAAWVIQGIALVALATVALLVTEGTDLLLQAPAILRYASQHDGAREPGISSIPQIQPPASHRLRWKSSGSAWLDERTRPVRLQIETSVEDEAVTVEMGDGQLAVVYERVKKSPVTLDIEIVPETSYLLEVAGPAGASVSITAFGLLDVVME